MLQRLLIPGLRRAADAALVLTIHRGTSAGDAADRKLDLGEVEFSLGAPSCSLENWGCNWRRTIHELEIRAGGVKTTVEPWSSKEIQLNGAGYRVDFEGSSSNDAVFSGLSCGALRLDADTYQLIRTEP